MDDTDFCSVPRSARPPVISVPHSQPKAKPSFTTPTNQVRMPTAISGLTWSHDDGFRAAVCPPYGCRKTKLGALERAGERTCLLPWLSRCDPVYLCACVSMKTSSISLIPRNRHSRLYSSMVTKCHRHRTMKRPLAIQLHNDSQLWNFSHERSPLYLRAHAHRVQRDLVSRR